MVSPNSNPKCLKTNYFFLLVDFSMCYKVRANSENFMNTKYNMIYIIYNKYNLRR